MYRRVPSRQACGKTVSSATVTDAPTLALGTTRATRRDMCSHLLVKFGAMQTVHTSFHSPWAYSTIPMQCRRETKHYLVCHTPVLPRDQRPDSSINQRGNALTLDVAVHRWFGAYEVTFLPQGMNKYRAVKLVGVDFTFQSKSGTDVVEFFCSDRSIPMPEPAFLQNSDTQQLPFYLGRASDGKLRLYRRSTPCWRNHKRRPVGDDPNPSPTCSPRPHSTRPIRYDTER